MASNSGTEDKLKAKVKEQLKKKASQKKAAAEDDAEKQSNQLNEGDFTELAVSPPPASRAFSRRSKASVRQDVSMFCRELAILLDSGYPLLRALTLLANKTSNRKFAGEIDRVARQVEKGSTLAKGLATADEYFEPMLISMIEAGETSGELVHVLTNIADDMDANDVLADKIRQAIAYPVLTALIAVLVFFVILIFVVPTFNEVYERDNMELPAITSILVALSNFVTGYWWLWIPAIVLAGWYVWRRSGENVHAFDNFVLKIPLVGEVVVLGTMARFATAMQVMLSNGVPMLQALQLAKGVVQNSNLQVVVQQMSDNVESGKSLAAPMAQAGYFPPIMVDMLYVGEESGKLPFVLGQIVLALRVQLDRIISRLSVVLGPVMTLIVGVMVLLITLSLFIPYFGFLTALAEVPFK